MTVGPVPHVAKPRRTPSRLVQKRIFWPPSWDMANCYVMVSHPATSDLVICVDFDMSALLSAFYNTRHRVRPRPVRLSPSCVRSANNRHNRSSSYVLASIDFAVRNATRGYQRLGISTATSIRGPWSRDAWSRFCPIAIWRRFARDRRGRDANRAIAG